MLFYVNSAEDPRGVYIYGYGAVGGLSFSLVSDAAEYGGRGNLDVYAFGEEYIDSAESSNSVYGNIVIDNGIFKVNFNAAEYSDKVCTFKFFFDVGFISPVATDFTIKICPGATGRFSGFCRLAAKRSLTFIKRVIVDKLTVIPAFFSRL